jgi:uncharacterized protein (DUF1501 family)
LNGFDTHGNQPGRHQRLLTELGEALAAFRTALIGTGRWKSVLLMTYSEFGRRVAENQSLGTDHGTAAPHLVMGGAVEGGLHGAAPSLSRLANGNLRYTTHYRRLYATVTQHWWQLREPAWQRRFPPMDWV